MAEQVNAQFGIKSWQEKTYLEFDGRKMTRATVEKAFQGDIEGEASLEYLMTYIDEGTASLVGMERVVGRLRGRSGSFVLQHVGTFAGGVSTVSLTVVAGSGTGELDGLRGEGTFVSGHAARYPVTLHCTFD